MPTSSHILRLMHHVSVDGSLLGPEDKEAYLFTNELRIAAIQGRLRAVFTHPANELAFTPGRKKPTLAAAIARALGLITGTSDYLFLWDRGCMAIEFKSKSGSLRPAQRDFRDWCREMDVPFHVVRCHKAGLDLLFKAGALYR